MNKALAADTHSAIWYIADSPDLSFIAVKAMDEATDAGEPVYVSAITLVEMAYLIEKGRLPEQDLIDLLNRLQNHLSNFELIPVNLAVTQSLRQIKRDEVPDMPDRIIAATALYLNVPLVTRDGKIRAINLAAIC
ncbi:MAG: type II toxin-antitoxin system VapC family toxin [Acidobacteriota bacterium]|nr:type II toxin-antitoxin system VapC family toxin [Acidobacteriota bacterium]